MIKNIDLLFNKKLIAKILILSLVLEGIALIGNPRTVNATIVQASSDTMTRHKLSTLSSHTLAVTLSASETLATGETMIFTYKDLPSAGTWTFPLDSAWAVGDFSLNDGSARGNPDEVGNSASCTGHSGTNDYIITNDQANKKFTLTTCGSWSASGSGATVTLQVGTVAGGTDRITNPGTAGRYEIWITGTFGDDQSEAEVPILTDDQVSVSATVDTYISFDVTTTNGSDNAINLGELNFAGNPSGSVTSSNDTARTNQAGSTLPADNISLTLDTNAYGGTIIQVKSLNGGLKSTANSYTLTSASETLAINQNDVSDTAGYGLQAQTATTTQ